MTPQIMGIVNVTPDSFSDGGKFLHADGAIAHGLKLIEEGADILDIGGESTRPRAEPVSPEEEQKHVLPVLRGLRDEADKRGVTLSIDTRNASTIKAALEAGASMINDVSALTHDVASMGIAAYSKAKIVLMHMKGTPETMQDNPAYTDVVAEVCAYLQARIAACLVAGITKDRLIIDPGIGFGKTAEHNIALLQNIPALTALGVPVMIGASRKSFISKLAGGEDRLAGSLAIALHAAAAGASILRVHDVAATRQALGMHAVLQRGMPFA